MSAVPGEPRARGKGWIRVLRVALLAASAALLASALRDADLGRAGALVVRMGPWCVLVLLPALLGNGLQTLGWRPVLELLGCRVRAGVLLLVRVASEAVFMTAPAGTAVADSTALWMLERRLGVPVPAGLAALAARRTLLVLTNGLYVALAFVLGHAYLERAATGLGGGPWLAWLVLGMAGILLGSSALMAAALLSGNLAGWLRRLLERFPLRASRAWLAARAAGFAETDRHLASLRRAPRGRLGASVAAFSLAWLTDALDTMIVLRLVGGHLGFVQILAVEVLVSLMRSVAFALPSAVGVQDVGYVTLFAAFGLPDAATVGLAFLILKRAKEIVWIAIGYAILLVFGQGRRTATGAGLVASSGAGRTLANGTNPTAGPSVAKASRW